MLVVVRVAEVCEPWQQLRQVETAAHDGVRAKALRPRWKVAVQVVRCGCDSDQTERHREK
jgi:hypothetical protein